MTKTSCRFTVTPALVLRLVRTGANSFSGGEVVRLSRLRKLVIAISISSMLIALSDSFARAQQSLTAATHESALPDAPVPVQVGAQAAPADLRQSGTGNISGTILDSNQNVAPGAQVELLSPTGSVVETTISGSNGEFQFAGLTQGLYRLKASAPNMAPQYPNRFHCVPASFVSPRR